MRAGQREAQERCDVGTSHSSHGGQTTIMSDDDRTGVYRVPPHLPDTLPDLERLYPPFEESHHGS